VVPVRERDNSGFCKKWVRRAGLNLECYLTIVEVIQMTVRVIWIINDQRPTQAIAILSLVMAVIPECTLKTQKISCRGLAECRKYFTAWSSVLNW
jgi:hypothetical protein